MPEISMLIFEVGVRSKSFEKVSFPGDSPGDMMPSLIARFVLIKPKPFNVPSLVNVLGVEVGLVIARILLFVCRLIIPVFFHRVWSIDKALSILNRPLVLLITSPVKLAVPVPF